MPAKQSVIWRFGYKTRSGIVVEQPGLGLPIRAATLNLFQEYLSMTDSCCNVPRLDKQPTPEEQGRQNTLYLQIQGMNCGTCVNRVRNALLTTYGVTSVIVEQAQGLAEVRFHPALTGAPALIDAVRSAGGDDRHEYSARLLSLEE